MNNRQAVRKLLAIDDEPDMLGLMRDVLGPEGYRVLGAASGDEGVRLNAAEDPDLIILDLRMPGMGGIEVLRRIRQEDPEVRVIILTGYGDPDSIRDAADLDVSEYLSKPFENSRLVGVVDAAIGRRPEGPR